MTNSTAVAHPNIALIKYWGKRDEALHLPTTTSLSMTLDVFPTETTVTLLDAGEDATTLNGAAAPGPFADKVSGFLDVVRTLAGDDRRARVDTVNSVPTAAGLASSASGFAALALAASNAYGLDLDRRALSRLARRGSGSASRSVFGGFAVWYRGEGTGAEGDLSSYAEPVDSALDAAMVVAVVDAREKTVSSRTAMRSTVATSPLYRPWVDSSALDLVAIRQALADGDLVTVGEIAESNALGMHATMLGARPPIRYLAPASVAVLDRVQQLRSDGIAAYATMDAGPNVKVLCARGDAADVDAALSEVAGVTSTRIARPGEGVQAR
ncbi:MAG: diphosphomevalonate decarboxylase [Gordonia sp. (in: high G+C Gram-positive bacteria)]|uniref:diphosphomevalonate decarboxylase n=1 Tax=Gordonia sp. (in: high G+C Gram-positive bacteria) TaxID=84139 RepID=UPI0039E28CB7